MIEILKKHPNFKALEFACRAVSKDSTRGSLQYLNIDEPLLAVATDGRRLHEARLPSEMETGLFKVLKRTASVLWLEPAPADSLPYPNWQQVRCDEAQGRLDRVFESSQGFSWLFCTVLAEFGKTAFDIELFREALPPKGVKFQFSQADTIMPLVIRSTDGNFRSVVMPIRLLP